MSTPSPRPIDPTTVHAATPPAPRPARRRIPRAVWIVAVLLLLVMLYRWWQAPEGDGAAEYITMPVDRGAIEQTVIATGTVNPVKTVQVGTYVSGPILAIDVDYNSAVTKGQRVAKIDAASFIEGPTGRGEPGDGACARRQAAPTCLKRLLLDHNRKLLAAKLLAQNDLDTAKATPTRRRAARARRGVGQQAQAGLDERA
jgi:HlyD family secretion protein